MIFFILYIDFNPGVSILTNAFSLQISRTLITKGAGGRGEALRSAPTPQGVTGRVKDLGQVRSFQVLEDLQGVPPLPPAPPKSSSKSDQKSNQKIYQIFDPKWPPKGTLKISKMSPHL